MKILQTIGGFGLKSGGTTTCTYDLLRYMHNSTDCRVDILTPNVISANDTLAGSGDEVASLGDNGKRLVAEKYSAGKVAQMMAQLYQWLLGEGERPEFVIL